MRGVEIFSCQLAHELNLLGVTAHVLYLFSGDVGLLDLFPHIVFIDLKADENKRFYDFRAFKKLNQIIRLGKYGIVQANAGDTLKYCAFSKVLFGWKAPLVYRNASMMSYYIRNCFQRILNRWFLQKCSYIISVSNSCQKDLLTLYAGASSKIVTIYVGTYIFDSIVPIIRPVNADGPIFVNVGSLVAEKNQMFLIEVFYQYFKQYQSGYLWLIGDGVMMNALQNRVKEFEIQERVVFWGYRTDVINLLAATDIFIMTSRIEGLPGVVLESLSCGIPVIASAVGGIPEIIVHGVNGFCLEKEETSSYVSCMRILVTDQNVKQRFIKNGKNLIDEILLMPQIAKKFVANYKIVLGE